MCQISQQNEKAIIGFNYRYIFRGMIPDSVNASGRIYNSVAGKGERVTEGGWRDMERDREMKRMIDI